MSSWSTLTLELRDRERYYDETGGRIADDCQDRLHAAVDQIFSGVSFARAENSDGEEASYVVAVVGGSRDWSDDVRLIEEVDDLVTRAVVVHADDTRNIGSARLYECEGDAFVATDEYEETQDDDGYHWGMKAASYMHVHHNIPALAKTNPLDEASERDDYTHGTPLSRPR